MIEVKNLEKSFGEQKVLNDVSLVCPNGEITGIIGHNGSGKTVLFKCICGLLFEDSGEILIDGKRYKSGGELIKNAGIIIENPAFLEQLVQKIEEYEKYGGENWLEVDADWDAVKNTVTID